MITTIAALLFITLKQHDLQGESANIGWYRLDDGQCHSLAMYHEATVPQLTLASAAATERANEIIESEARDMAGYGEDKDEAPPEGCTKANVRHDPGEINGQSVDCEVAFATDRFVSLRCRVGAMGTHPSGHVEALNLLVDGDAVEQLGDLDELFLPGSNYKSLLHADEDMGELEAVTFNGEGLFMDFRRGDYTISWRNAAKYLRSEILAAYKSKQWISDCTSRTLHGTSDCRSARD